MPAAKSGSTRRKKPEKKTTAPAAEASEARGRSAGRNRELTRPELEALREKLRRKFHTR